MWAGYQRLVTNPSLLSLWCNTIGTSEDERFLRLYCQIVTRGVMDEVVRMTFPTHAPETQRSQQHLLKADEEQALRYAAGYVVMKLHEADREPYND